MGISQIPAVVPDSDEGCVRFRNDLNLEALARGVIVRGGLNGLIVLVQIPDQSVDLRLIIDVRDHQNHPEELVLPLDFLEHAMEEIAEDQSEDRFPHCPVRKAGGFSRIDVGPFGEYDSPRIEPHVARSDFGELQIGHQFQRGVSGPGCRTAQERLYECIGLADLRFIGIFGYYWIGVDEKDGFVQRIARFSLPKHLIVIG